MLKISFARPFIPNKKRLADYIERSTDKYFLSNFGPNERELTEKLEQYFDTSNLLLVNNATSGLNVASKIIFKDNIVITTPYSFRATATSVLNAGYRLKFIDIDYEDVEPNFARVKENNVLAVNVYGRVSSAIKRNKSKAHRLLIDNAHGFDTVHNEKHSCNFGTASVLSFHCTKTFHTVEGGAVRFNNRDHFLEAKDRINFGLKNPEKGVDGMNYKLSEFHAAMGLANLKQIDEILDNRWELIEKYDKVIKQHNVSKIESGSCSYYPIKFVTTAKANLFQSHMMKNGIEVRKYFDTSLNIPFSDIKCKNSENLAGRVVCLPLASNFSSSEVVKILKSLNDYLS